MKNIANRLFVFAAAALSLGTLAYGQTVVKADIPFTFIAPGGPAPAGEYMLAIKNDGNGSIVYLTSVKTGHTVLSATSNLGDNSGKPIAPRLVFACGEEGCALSQVWSTTNGYGVLAKRVRHPEYIASIALTVSHN
jgi:hypothetical protein